MTEREKRLERLYLAAIGSPAYPPSSWAEDASADYAALRREPNTTLRENIKGCIEDVLEGEMYTSEDAVDDILYLLQ